MISKRTAIILIVAIAAIIIFEMSFSFDKMSEMEEKLDHTVAQITLNINGELTSLEGTEVKYEYDGAQQPLTAKLGELNETGYENIQNNQVAYKPCAAGSNKLSFTIPKELIPTCEQDISVTFGCEDNQADFNNYSLIINLTTDEAAVNAEVLQTVYYPDENGNALNEKAETSTIINSENSRIECLIK